MQCGVNPRQWLKEVLEKIPEYPINKIDESTPITPFFIVNKFLSVSVLSLVLDIIGRKLSLYEVL
ncbi:MAG: transposase domain-containing protein [Saprospirales bacterium]|nr:MAG: transposase domain-containing protein [Saprospirales bacterium]